MKAVIRSGAAGVLLSLSIGGWPALAGEKLTLASGQSDAATYVAGVGLSSLIKFELLPRDKIDLLVVESGGAVDSLRRLQAGEADFAILPSAIGHAARLGIGSFAGDPPETGLRAVAALWRDALHLVVREADVATGTIDDLSSLKDRTLSLGDTAGDMADAHRLLLSDLGMDAARNVQLASIADSDGMAAIERGEIDVFSATGRPPLAMFEGFFATPSSGLRLLDVTETQMARINGNHWLWTPYVIPASTYPGQSEDIWTIALSSLLVVRADVDPDVVYAITKSIFENLRYLQRIDPVMSDLSLDTALTGMTMPLHPGAHRYFTEAGSIPGAVSDEGAEPAAVTPVGQDRERPGITPEHYPDADVAGEWPAGAGGPLQKTAPGRDATGPSPRPSPDGELEPQPFWRQRATL